MGTIETVVFFERWKGPFLNLFNSPVLVRVPSGAIKKDVPLEVSIKDLSVGEEEKELLKRIYTELEFKT